MMELIPLILSIMCAAAFILIVHHDGTVDERRLTELGKHNRLLSRRSSSKLPVDKF